MSKNLGKSDNPSNRNLGNNSSERLLKVKEIAALLNESDNVIRNWIKELKNYIPIQKNEVGYQLFDDKAIEVMQTIHHLHRDRGYTVRQIELYLASGGKELPYTPPAGPDVWKKLIEVEELLKQQNEFNQALVDRLDRQQEFIEKSIKDRDEQLMNTIRALQEGKKNHSWLKFWKKR